MLSTLHIDSGRAWGGGQQQSLGLALELAARGGRVHFVAQRNGVLAARLASTGLPWESMCLRGAAVAGAAVRLCRRFRQLRPDLVHVHDSAALLPALLASSILSPAGPGRRRPRLVFTRRTDFPPARRVLLPRPELRADRVICVSEAARQRLVAGGLPVARLVVIPDFVDCHHFDPADAPAASKDPRPTVVSVGRLSPEKGHAVLLAAMGQVVAAIPQARLVVCGEGKERSSLKELTEAEGLSASVEFAGFVPDVRTALWVADIFAMPSLSEGLGVAALEAMAMAKPVVASRTGGLPEVVADGETGLLVAPGDRGSLARAVISLLEDPSRARAMGEAGRRRALARFDRPRIVDRVVEMYQKVLSEG